VNENGENMDGSKVSIWGFRSYYKYIRYYKTFIEKNMSHLIFVIAWCKTIDVRGKHTKRRAPTMWCILK
jgi:hypothetical protein